MGWVDDTFRERIASETEVPKLWDSLRDSIGLAVEEFNRRTAASLDTLERNNCMAMGRHCLRVRRTLGGSAIEVFLDEQNQSLTVARNGLNKLVCGYRLSKDLSQAEFFIQKEGDTPERMLPVEEACRRALKELLFSPFPTAFSR
jgi:hypothetical protein